MPFSWFTIIWGKILQNFIKSNRSKHVALMILTRCSYIWQQTSIENDIVTILGQIQLYLCISPLQITEPILTKTYIAQVNSVAILSQLNSQNSVTKNFSQRLCPRRICWKFLKKIPSEHSLLLELSIVAHL